LILNSPRSSRKFWDILPWSRFFLLLVIS
jgi:hypothetical protein